MHTIILNPVVNVFFHLKKVWNLKLYGLNSIITLRNSHIKFIFNIEILNRSISNPEFWFFSKFLIFYNAYRGKPWIIPIKLLFLHFKNVSKNKKNITRKKKIIDIFRPSKKNKSLELEFETRNRAKALYADQINLELSLSNQEKRIPHQHLLALPINIPLSFFFFS